MEQWLEQRFAASAVSEFCARRYQKIAYSASFGKAKLDEWEKEETKRLLQRYSAISVRESTGVSIIDDLGIGNAVHVLDPTLQLDKTFGRNMQEQENPKRNMSWSIS